MAYSSAYAPLGERVDRRGVFISRGETGLRPPKGTAKSEKDIGFGPQAGEGGSSIVRSYAGHHTRTVRAAKFNTAKQRRRRRPGRAQIDRCRANPELGW